MDGEADLHTVLASLGRRPPDRAPADLGSPGRTHVYVLDDIVVKCDDRYGSAAMQRERCSLELLAGKGLPVPSVIAHGELVDGRHWITLERLPGAPPPDAARPAHDVTPELAAEMGVMVAALHAAVRPPGFGTWERHPGRTLVEEERRRTELLGEMGRAAEIVARYELDAVLAALAATMDAVDGVALPVLAHRDVQPRNVLLDDGKLVALLDFESSAGGDPAEDFKVLGLDWTTPGFIAFCDGYAAAGGRLGRDGASRVVHHVLNWVLVVFSYLGGIRPAYIDVARRALDRATSGEVPRGACFD